MRRAHAATIAAAAFPAATLCLVVGTVYLQWRSTGASGFDDLGATLAFVAVSVSFSTVGGLIAARQPRNGIGWALCLFALNIPVETAVMAAFANGWQPQEPGIWIYWFTAWAWAPAVTAVIVYVPLTFPRGRPAGRAAWTTLALAILGAGMVVVGNALDPALLDAPTEVQGATTPLTNPFGVTGHDELLTTLTELGLLPVGLAVLASVAQLLVRWRRARSMQRQQYKSLLFGMTLLAIGVIANMLLYEAGREAVGQVVFGVFVVWLPVSIAVAIFRYRLYEIDRIISRTLAYTLVSGMLLAVYSGVVVTIRTLLPVTADEPFAVAASTLAAAAAFNPLRRRVQRAVDLRFNRARYDIQRAADAYRARLRDELDLDSISVDLLRTVRSTLQPAGTALWLRGQGAGR